MSNKFIRLYFKWWTRRNKKILWRKIVQD